PFCGVEAAWMVDSTAVAGELRCGRLRGDGSVPDVSWRPGRAEAATRRLGRRAFEWRDTGSSRFREDRHRDVGVADRVAAGGRWGNVEFRASLCRPSIPDRLGLGHSLPGPWPR